MTMASTMVAKTQNRYAMIVPSTKEAHAEALVNYVMQAWDDSCDENYGYRKRLPLIYQLHRGIRTGRFHVHKHNVHIPIILSAAETDSNRKTAISFSDPNPIAFMASDDANFAIAQKHAALINTQLRDMDMLLRASDFNRNDSLYGTGVALGSWDHQSHESSGIDTAQLPVSGERLRVFRDKKTLIDYNGPCFEVIDNLDAGPQAGVARLRDMRHFTRRYTLNIDQVWDAVDAGQFVKSAVNKLVASGGASNEISSDIADMRMNRGAPLFGEGDSFGSVRDGVDRDVELHDFYGWIPRELALSGGDTLVLLTVANRKHLVRAVPFPYSSARLPFFDSSSMPDPHHFWGIGKGEVLARIQMATAKFTNQVLDLIQLAIDPMYVVSKQAQLNPDGLYGRPGRIFLTQGAPAEQWMTLAPNTSGAALGIQAGDKLWQWGQQGTGLIQDTVMGIASANYTTAHEYAGRREAVDSRLAFEAMRAEKAWIEPFADWMMMLNRENLEPGQEVMMLGQNALRDPWTQEDVRMTSFTITESDLTYFYRARALGASMKLGESVRIQRLFTLTGLLQQNPMTAATIQWVNWSKMMADVLGLPEATHLINTSEAAKEQLAMMQQQNGGQGVPNLNALGQPGLVGTQAQDGLIAALQQGGLAGQGAS